MSEMMPTGVDPICPTCGQYTHGITICPPQQFSPWNWNPNLGFFNYGYESTAEVLVKKIHADAVIPSKAHETDSGWDLTAIDDGILKDGFLQYDTGLTIELPAGYDALIYPRSSISKYDLALANSVGLIDEGYRGNLIVRFKPTVSFDSLYFIKLTKSVKPTVYKKGDKIAQIVFRKKPSVTMREVDDSLSSSDRGEGGFGSSGS